jgi:predicted GTPase
VGGPRSGKSSFINAVLTALEDGDDVRNRAIVGGADMDGLSSSSSPSSSATSSTRASLSSLGAARTQAFDLPTTQFIERYDVSPRVVLWDTWGWSQGSASLFDRDTINELLAGRLRSPYPLAKAVVNTRAPSALGTDTAESYDIQQQMHGILVSCNATVATIDGIVSVLCRQVKCSMLMAT